MRENSKKLKSLISYRQKQNLSKQYSKLIGIQHNMNKTGFYENTYMPWRFDLKNEYNILEVKSKSKQNKNYEMLLHSKISITDNIKCKIFVGLWNSSITENVVLLNYFIFN